MPLLILSSALLTACGGGSSSASVDNTGGTGGNGGTGGSNTNTVTLSASAVQSTVCNTKVPVSSAELVVYDDNWAIKSRHKADANGNINATIPQTNNVNISFIGTSGEGSSRRITVDSYTQHPVGDLGIYTVPGVSNDGCECQTTTVDVTSEVSTLTNGAQLAGNNINSPAYHSGVNSNVVQYNDVEICRPLNGQWPTLYASSDRLDDIQAAGYLSEYDPAGPLMIVLQQTPTSYSANFDAASLSGSVTHHFDEAYLTFIESYPGADISLFDELPGVTAISLRASQNNSEYFDGLEVRVGRMKRHSLTLPYTSTIDVDLPNAESSAILLQQILGWLDSEDTSYDLSGISDFDTFSIALLTTLTDGSSYQQYFYGPKRGNIPDEVLPGDYGVDQLLDENNFSINASMLRYGNQQTYQQYLQSKTDASRMTLTERLLGNRSQFNQIYVDITR